MDVTRLAHNAFLLRLPDVTILLDCPLDVSSLGAYLPQYYTHSFDGGGSSTTPANAGPALVLNNGQLMADAPSGFRFRAARLDMIDVGAIDVVLVSNCTGLLGVPLLMRDPRFRGRVYATEPVLELGRQLMEELVHFVSIGRTTQQQQQQQQQQHQSLASLPLRDGQHLPATAAAPSFPTNVDDSLFWVTLYSREDVAACVDRVHRCSYLQDIPTYGNLHLRPTSSGHSLGACNWVISSGSTAAGLGLPLKVVYLSASSSVVSRHPEQLDWRPLADANLVIATGFSREPTRSQDPMINDLCSFVLTTVKKRGNVLIPCLPTGVVYDLIEVVAAYLLNMNQGAVPIYLVSPVVDQSLGYANILGEWMSKNRQDKTFLPEPPFCHADLVRSNRVKHFPNLHGSFGATMRSPCVVFCGHPSLRCGDVVHLMRLWGSSSKNSVIFIDPEYPPAPALAPYHPLAMRVCYTPIDPSLNYAEASGLLTSLKPRQIIVQRDDMDAGFLLPPALANTARLHIFPARAGECISVADAAVGGGGSTETHTSGRAELSELLAREIQPTLVGTKRVHRLAAILSFSNHQLSLIPPSKHDLHKMKARRRRLLFGNIAVETLLDQLNASDVGSIDVHSSPDRSCVTITLAALGAVIRIDGAKTSVEVADRETRHLLKTLLLGQLERL